MSRKFIATIAAVSLLGAGLGAGPAKADSEDVARTLAGLTALFIIGKALSDKDDKKRTHQYGHTYNHGGHTYGHDHHHGKPIKVDPRPLPPNVKHTSAKYLPNRCLTVINTRHDRFAFMRATCLKNNYRWSSKLPRDCRVKISGQRGVRTGYAATCLKRKGYSLNG